MLSGGTQRTHARHQSKEIKILYITFPRVRMEPTTCRVYIHTIVPLHHDWLHKICKYINIIIWTKNGKLTNISLGTCIYPIYKYIYHVNRTLLSPILSIQ